MKTCVLSIWRELKVLTTHRKQGHSWTSGTVLAQSCECSAGTERVETHPLKHVVSWENGAVVLPIRDLAEQMCNVTSPTDV